MSLIDARGTTRAKLDAGIFCGELGVPGAGCSKYQIDILEPLSE